MTLLQTKGILYVWLKSRPWELQNWHCLLKMQFLEENLTLEKVQNFHKTGRRNRKIPYSSISAFYHIVCTFQSFTTWKNGCTVAWKFQCKVLPPQHSLVLLIFPRSPLSTVCCPSFLWAIAVCYPPCQGDSYLCSYSILSTSPHLVTIFHANATHLSVVSC